MSRISLVGSIRIPGDKSISHRVLLLSALARGISTVEGLNVGDDVVATAQALHRLGVPCRIDPVSATAELEGYGLHGLQEPEDVLDCGNSGTALRTLLGVCASIPGLSILTGDASLRRRPMGRVVSPLREMGAEIGGRQDASMPPLYVLGRRLTGSSVAMQVPSAQVKTALLLAGLSAEGWTRIREPLPSRDHTERLLAHAGVVVRRDGATIAVEGGQEPSPATWRVPGDVSSATFFLVAACLLDRSDLTVLEVGLNPTRTGAIAVLRRMGADLEIETTGQQCGEPVGRVRARSAPLKAASIEPAEIPALIDKLPVLAIAATQAEGSTVIRGAGELRVKESDRIETVVEALRTVGARAEGLEDGLVVHGPSALRGGQIDARGDHRVAMAFAVAGLLASGNITVKGWKSVTTSFPQFLDVLSSVTRRRSGTTRRKRA